MTNVTGRAGAALLLLLSSCAPLNFALIASHNARLNAHSRRIIMLEGEIVDMSEQGRRMAEDGGATVALEIEFPCRSKHPTAFVVVVPKHKYAGSLVRHFVDLVNLTNVPMEVEHLARFQALTCIGDGATAQATASIESLPDGHYLVAVCDHYLRQSYDHHDDGYRTQGQTKSVVRAVYAGHVEVDGGVAPRLELTAAEGIDKPTERTVDLRRRLDLPDETQ